MVSVIICARNESENLKKNIPVLLRQKYRHFEVIIVDHDSNDDTKKIVEGFSDPRLIYTRCAFTSPGKRKALNHGINQSSGEVILLTDADCRASSELWISKMVAPFESGAMTVLGAGPFSPRKGALNAVARWENFVTLQLYSSQTMRNRPFMAVGRNLAYMKALVADHSSYPRSQLIGGDDDLLINQHRNKPTQLVLDPDALMESPAKSRLNEFLRQKHRHISTGHQYHFYDQALLLFFAGSTWVYLIGVVLLMGYGYLLAGALLYLVRWYMLHMRTSTLKTANNHYSFGFWLPFVDLSYLLYYPLVSLFLLSKPPSQWN